MKALEKVFLKMTGREQNLLVVSLWVVFAVILIQSLQVSFTLYSDWRINEQTINGHQMIIGLNLPSMLLLNSKKLSRKIKATTKTNSVIWPLNWRTVSFLREVITNSIPMRRIGTDSTP